MLLLRPLSYVWKKQNDFAKSIGQQPLNRKQEVIKSDGPWIVLRLKSGMFLDPGDRLVPSPSEEAYNVGWEFQERSRENIIFAVGNGLS